MNTREFEENDRARLAEIYVLARKIGFPWLDSASFFRKDFDRDTDGEIIWVCEIEAELVGFVSAWLPTNFIHNLYVHPDHIGKGYGKRLLSVALSILDSPVTLKCQKRNVPAVEFYKSAGWVETGSGESEAGEYLVMEYTYAA